MLLKFLNKYGYAIAFIAGYFIGYERWIQPQNHYQIPFAVAIIAFLAMVSKW